MTKIYNQTSGVGDSKYVVNFHDGVKKHNDGSQFFDIKIFSNEKTMLEFIKKLELEGYTYSN